MSDFSLTLVLQIKTSKIINDMAKVQQKSEKISAFGGIFFVLLKEHFFASESPKNRVVCLKTTTGLFVPISDFRFQISVKPKKMNSELLLYYIIYI